MAPTRTQSRQHADPSTSSTSSQKQPKQHKRHPHYPEPPLNATPGVQKIKASLRQTRRLLAKESLAADVRVTAERRLKQLEGELVEAERARKERVMATRYHQVKFFERQKVTRKITQTKKTLEASDLGNKERRKVEKTLFELRVDLNYILHYPKTEKYVSLFPPAARGKETPEASDAVAEEQAKTDALREEVRADMRRAMESGKVSEEPEVEKMEREMKAPLVRKEVRPIANNRKGKERVADEHHEAQPPTMAKAKAKAAVATRDDFFEAASDGGDDDDVEIADGVGSDEVDGDDSEDDDK